jgi:hypothetical protein
MPTRYYRGDQVRLYFDRYDLSHPQSRITFLDAATPLWMEARDFADEGQARLDLAERLGELSGNVIYPRGILARIRTRLAHGRTVETICGLGAAYEQRRKRRAPWELTVGALAVQRVHQGENLGALLAWDCTAGHTVDSPIRDPHNTIRELVQGKIDGPPQNAEAVLDEAQLTVGALRTGMDAMWPENRHIQVRYRQGM